MKIVFVCDSYPPLENSAALQIHDLVTELSNCCDIVVLTRGVDDSCLKVFQMEAGIVVITYGSFKKSGQGYMKRLLDEVLWPIRMVYNYADYEKILIGSRAIVWYSPSIFLQFLVFFLKIKLKIRALLILRDVFPDWAWDLEIIKSIFVYYPLKLISIAQYLVADFIGIQSKGNKNYLWVPFHDVNKKVFLLENWLSKKSDSICQLGDIEKFIRRADSNKIILYAGNIGVAQDVLKVISDLKCLKEHKCKILLVGGGDQYQDIKRYVSENGIRDIGIYPAIPNTHMPSLIKSCHYGLVVLDSRHKSHNIPGKFINYVAHSLPVIALVNLNNDICEIIDNYRVGVHAESSEHGLAEALSKLSSSEYSTIDYAKNCNILYNERYTAAAAAHKVLSIINGSTGE